MSDAPGRGGRQGTTAQRQSRLLDHVMDHGRVPVADLAEVLGVSRVTIRKDLDRLAGQGLLGREHGFAVAVSTDEIAGRLAYHRDVKQRLAAVAAGMVADGETVMIESGSVCALLAEELASAARDVTIVTNSVFIAEYVRDLPSASVVLLGGAFQARAEVTVGPLVADAAAHFRVDKLFIGLDGHLSGQGFMAKDVMRAEAVRAMARQAAQLIVVTESAKFQRPGLVKLADTGEVAAVITDDRLGTEALAELSDAGVRVLRVSCDRE